MNESANKGTVAEAIFGITLLFLLLIFLLYKFGTNKGTVTSPEQNKTVDAKTELLNQFNSPETENDLYKKYAKEVYDAQSEGKGSIETQNKVEQIVLSYQKDLENETLLPQQNVLLKNISDKFTKKNYEDNFEIIISDFKKNGGTTEAPILSSQITPEGNLLVLSEDDKENILRIAGQYEVFANKIQNLSTPTSLEKIGKEIAISSLNVAYILKKLANEEDKNIYTLWISKYAENMSVIITDRYAIHAK